MKISFSFSLFCCVCACALLTPDAWARQQGRQGRQAPFTEADRQECVAAIADSQAFLMSLMEDPQLSIPKELIADAKAIVILDHLKISFVFGLRGGSGIGLLHNGTGGWSPPAFYSIGGANLGLQAGGEARRSVLLIMSEEGTRLLTGDAGMLGMGISAVAGPRGANADVSNFDKVPVLFYTDASGLFAGAAFEGAILSPSPKANTGFYNDHGASALKILESRVETPAEAQNLLLQLRRLVYEGQQLKRSRR